MTHSVGRLVVRAAGATDRGKVRPNNQDTFLLLPDRGIFIVADGMGGANGGEVAARMAVETIDELYTEADAAALVDVIAETNHRIHEAAAELNLRGMGTTTVAVAIVPDESEHDDDADPVDEAQYIMVVNVGDSRAYLFRDGGITQLTDDHSVVAELVRGGRLTPLEAEAHPQRNIITRVLGVYPEVTPDLWPVDPVRGDRYLLCSDGLSNEVTTDQMAAVLRRLEDPAEAADELLRLANEGGGRDNITVVVVDVVDDGGVAARASSALAGRVSAASRGKADLAGFTATAPATVGSDGATTRRARRAARRAERRERRSGRSRLTWRVVLFTVLLLAVIGGAVATIQWYGTSTYFVGFDGDEVSIFRGRPGGLLWIDPTLEEGTAITRDEVPARYLAAIEAGHQHSSLAKAKLYVSNVERDIIDHPPATTTTTTAPTSSSTTTTPAAN